MGFALTILYLFTAYLAPPTVFGPLAAFHVELIVAGLAVIVSVPALQGSIVTKTPQSLALVGLAFATLLSILTTGWAGGSLQVFLNFIPNAFAYYLLCLHCNSKKKLQVVVLLLLFVCLFVIVHGYSSLQHLPPPNAQMERVVDTDDSYVLAQESDSGEWFYRIRGLDFIHDPNDFAQVIVCLTPLMFIFWRRKKWVRNFIFVILPISALLYGAFLAHSRGSVMAFAAMAVVALRRRIGTVPALILAGSLFVAASALHFTGGRDISLSAGEERTALWGESLELLKSHPLFGIGYGNLPDYIGHTAHNSIAVCAAELGLTGLYFWSLFLFPTVRDLLVVASPQKTTDGVLIEPAPGPFPKRIEKFEAIDKADANNLGRILILSLTGFMVAGWFLSRAFTMTLFLLGGIAEVVFELALKRGMVPPRLALGRVLWYACACTIGLLVLMNILLRTLNAMY